MTDSPTLFDTSWRRVETVHGLARWNDPSTSQEAAKKISGRTEVRILEVMADGKGRTADEIGEALPNIFPPTLRGAVSRCAAKGYLVAVGERPSNRGVAMTVWKLAELREDTE